MKKKLVSFLTLCTLLLVPTIVFAEETNGNIGYVTPERLKAIVAGVVGLISVAIGVLSLARSSGRFGTGSGRAGAIVAIVVGLAGMILAGLTLARSRRVD